MKKIVLFLIISALSVSVSYANMFQGTWRWRNDNGSQTTATWKAAENTGLGTISNLSGNIRLRIELYSVDVINAGTYTMGLFYSSNSDTNWRQITNSASNAFILSPSVNFNDGDPTTSQLTPISVQATNFETGKIIESSLTFSHNLGLGERTEYEFSIAATANIQPNTTYFFQIRNDDNTPIDQYNTNPSFTTDAGLPVELTALKAEIMENDVGLSWKTITEINNYGFEIERALISSKKSGVWSQKENPDWERVGFVNGHGTSNSIKEYSYFDRDVSPGNYLYRLKQTDNDGQFNYSDWLEVTVLKPFDFALQQNYPNPFNPVTKIIYSIGNGMGNQHVILKVYDALGKEAATLVNEVKEQGVYETTFNAAGLSSGMYLYSLEAGDMKLVKKMIILK